MNRIPSTLRVLHLFVFALLLCGGACRDDDDPSFLGENPDLSEADASPIVGTVTGSFAVSPTGEATYTIPLVVPPGAAGMQPTLAITYDSAAGDGLLGMGFSLSGLSAVTRCPRSVAQDGRIRAVRDDAEDALCLDGARLVPIRQERQTPPNTAPSRTPSPGSSRNPAISTQTPLPPSRSSPDRAASWTTAARLTPGSWAGAA